MPNNKEPWFFSFNGLAKINEEIFDRKQGIVTDFNEYLNLFKNAKNTQIFGEASTVYLYLYEETIKNIKKYYSDWKNLRILIIIRNPVERAFSHYLDDSISGSLNMSFEEVIEKWRSKQLSRFYNYIDYGFYYNQIKAYMDNFDQVMVCLFDDLEMNPLRQVHDVFNFFKISDFFVPDTSLKYNSSTGAKGSIIKSRFIRDLINKPNYFKKIITTLLPVGFRVRMENVVFEKLTCKPRMENNTKKYLIEIYKKDILKLQDLINRDLSNWLNHAYSEEKIIK